MNANSIDPIIEAALDAKEAYVESACGKEDQWMRAVKLGRCGVKLEDMMAFLKAIGLQVLPANWVAVDPKVLQAYKTLAREHFKDAGPVEGE